MAAQNFTVEQYVDKTETLNVALGSEVMTENSRILFLVEKNLVVKRSAAEGGVNEIVIDVNNDEVDIAFGIYDFINLTPGEYTYKVVLAQTSGGRLSDYIEIANGTITVEEGEEDLPTIDSPELFTNGVAVKEVTGSSYTLSKDDDNIIINTALELCNLTLPDAKGLIGKRFVIKSKACGGPTVVNTDLVSIDEGGGAYIAGDGENWHVMIVSGETPA